MFTETPLVRKKRRHEVIAKVVLAAMSLSVVVPLVLIIGYLLVEAMPLLSWDFLTATRPGACAAGGSGRRCWGRCTW